MEQEQGAMAKRCGCAENPSDPTDAEMIELERCLGLKLPREGWARVPKLIRVSEERFKEVKRYVEAKKEEIEPELSRLPPGDARRKLDDAGRELRRLVEKPRETGEDEAVAEGYTEEEARVLFLWMTSHLLEAFGRAIGDGGGDEGAAIQRLDTVRNILNDQARALKSGGDIQPNILCTSCYPNYLTCCKSPSPGPTVCYSRYTYCCSTCV